MKITVSTLPSNRFFRETETFSVGIVPDPCWTSVISLNTTLPERWETEKYADFSKTNGIFQLHVVKRAYSLWYYEVSLASRYIVEPVQCKIVNFAIEEVKDASRKN